MRLTAVALGALTEESKIVHAKINEQVEGSAEIAQVVEALERQYDAFVSAQANRSLLARTKTSPAAMNSARSLNGSWLSTPRSSKKATTTPEQIHLVRPPRLWAPTRAAHEVPRSRARNPQLRRTSGIPTQTSDTPPRRVLEADPE